MNKTNTFSVAIGIILVGLVSTHSLANDALHVRWTKEVKVKDIKEVEALIDAKVDMSRAGKGCELILTKDDGSKIKVNTCREYWDAQEKGYAPYSTYDITMEDWFILDCGNLDFIKKAIPSEVSYLEDFVLSKEAIAYLPASLVIGFYGATDEEHNASEIRPLSSLGEGLIVTIVDDYNMDLEYDDTRNSIKLLAWGDYNHDGVEDILAHITHHYIGGSGRGYESVVLTRKVKDGPMIAVYYK